MILAILGGAGAFFALREPGATPSLPASAAHLEPKGEPVPVPGSSILFPPSTELKLPDRTAKLMLTGTALRTKYTLKIYGMGSYIEAGAAVTSAAELAAADKLKMMHLVMERKASGADFIDAFVAAVGKERANGEFGKEFAQLSQAIRTAAADKGQSIYMIYRPGVGTRIMVHDSVEVTIPGVAFGRAIWETYLGTKPISDEMKLHLVSRLSQ